MASGLLPIAGGAIAVALLMHAALAGGSPVTVWLAGGAIVAGLVRAMLLLADNQQLLDQSRADATTDKLTGLPNRRALDDDLDAALAGGRAHTLAFFDLDGFKEYNDTFGHAAGDALLQRLRPRSAATASAATSSACWCPARSTRTRPRSRGGRRPQRARRRRSRSPPRSGSSCSRTRRATRPRRCELADERMYARKRRRRATHARGVLQLLAEREAGVTRIAAEIGLVTLSDASPAAHGPARSSGAPSASSRSASPGR